MKKIQKINLEYITKFTNLVDTHSHIQMDYFKDDLNDTIERAKNSGVKRIILVGTTIEDSFKAKEVCEKYDGLYFSAGVHPHDVSDLIVEEIDELLNLTSHEKCVAIGEIGLDYFRNYSPHDKQKLFFEYQLKKAETMKIPVIIHVRDAYEDTWDIIKNYSGKAVFHCYSGDVEFMKKVIEKDFYLSLTGAITYGMEKGKKSRMEDVIKEVPLNRLMLETDCPYMAPNPYRGRRNEPGTIPFLAEAIALIKNITPLEIEKMTTENAEKFFRFGE